MKTLMICLCILWVGIFISESLEEDARVEERKTIMAYKKGLADDSAKLLVELQAMNHPKVSEFVEDWHRYYSTEGTYSEKTLSELKIIHQRLKNNPDEAEKLTLAHHQKFADGLNNAIESPFPFIDFEMDAKPGF